MKRLLTGFSLIVLQVLCIQFANAQMITGKIADESGEPIYGVSVQNLRTKNGTTSGADGRYRITARLNDSLLFSHTNYENQIFKVLGSTMNTALRAKDGTMSDVVVVGYGSQRKADLTVAVDKVNIKDLNKAQRPE